MSKTLKLPIIDISGLGNGEAATEPVAREIGAACRDYGFFYIAGHHVPPGLIGRLDRLSREFFALDLKTKLAIRMERGGRAWRGYFPVGAELTSGKPDQKEGLYFGSELSEDHPNVQAAIPLHGRNLFPELPGFKATVLEYLESMTLLGHRLISAIALSLGLEASYFEDRYTHDPLILFRIFHYPPIPADIELSSTWSVGEHTDYGLLTILRQDEVGGLQVKSRSQWLDADPIPDSFVVNLGDMLDRMTGGLYRSTPHRVLNTTQRGRLSFPFFFDSAWDATIAPIDHGKPVPDDRHDRWDQESVHQWQGTYGNYILRKVAKVFPQLAQGTGPAESTDVNDLIR